MVQSRIGAWHTKYKEACQKVFAKDFRMIRKLMKGYSDRSASKSVKNMYLAVAREMSSQIEGQINKQRRLEKGPFLKEGATAEGVK
jgi:hypothetical protein